jgi:hypothetical protein
MKSGAGAVISYSAEKVAVFGHFAPAKVILDVVTEAVAVAAPVTVSGSSPKVNVHSIAPQITFIAGEPRPGAKTRVPLPAVVAATPIAYGRPPAVGAQPGTKGAT